MFSSASINAAHPQASIRTQSKLIHPTIVPWPIKRHLEPTLLDSVILLPTLAQIGSLRAIFEILPFLVTVPTEVAVAELIINISFIDSGRTGSESPSAPATIFSNSSKSSSRVSQIGGSSPVSYTHLTLPTIYSV